MEKAFSHYLLAWEQQRCDEAVSDIFGYHSLQLGMPALQGLRCSRMPQRWLAALQPDLEALEVPAPVTEPAWMSAIDLACHPEALPFADNSLDLLVLPHTLERCEQPHTALREAVRTLMPEGRLLIFGFNPCSLWGLQHALERPRVKFPNATTGIIYWRLRDWLQVLALEIVAADFGCHAPAVDSSLWLQRWRWLDSVGQRVWPMLAGAYCILAIKKVHGVRLIKTGWRTPGRAAHITPAAARQYTAQRKKS